MLNEFIINPVCVHEIDIASENGKYTPFIKHTLVFLGDVPNEILKAAENEISSQKKLDSKKNSKILEQYYGSNWREKLGIVTTQFLSRKIGSADLDDGSEILDLGDELEKIDLFDVEEKPEIEEATVEQIEPAEEQPSKKQSKRKPEKEKERKVVDKKETSLEKKIVGRKITIVTDIHIYPEDRINEFKEKLYLASGIQPYKQHIYFLLRNNTIPLRYKVTLDEKNIPVDIDAMITLDTERIMGVPVDRSIYETRDSLRIEAYDQFFTLADIYEKYATNTFYMYNIDTFIYDKRLIEELKSDSYQMELMYYSFVMIFWPQITLDVFKIYLKNANEIPEIYPDLSPTVGILKSTYSSESVILDEKYSLLKDASEGYKKNSGFREYNPEFVTKSGLGKILQVSIKNATLSVEKERQYMKAQFGLSISSQVKINVRNLFDKIRITDDIPLIKVKLLRGRSPFILTKTKNPNIFGGENIRAIFEQIKYQLQIPYWNTILFALRAHDKSGKPIQSSQGVSKYIIVVLYDNGKYLIRSTWNEDASMDFQKITDIIEKTTGPFIDTINQLGRLVFESSERLNKVSASNSEFSELSMSLFWKKTISTTQFKSLLGTFEEDFKSRIIKPRESEVGLHEYLYFKGVTGYDISQIEKYISLQNYYAYLTDANVKQKWISLFNQGRMMSFNHRTSDVKIEVQNIREKEFRYFYHYIISFLYRNGRVLSSENTTSAAISLKPGTKINTLKLLKSKDPEAFIFKKYGSDVVYSRICQKDHQPIPFSQDDIKLLPPNEQDRAVKFINYTTGDDIYYLCRKGKYPYLSFITGQHPKNYCLPCCKKTPAYSSEVSSTKSKRTSAEEEEENKKERIYKLCTEKYEYIEQDEESGASRYVMNYGKDIYIGRIGKLPDTLQQYLLYNLENVDILSEFTIARTFIMNGKKYSVDRLFKITKNIKIHKIPISELVHHLKYKSWEYKNEGVADISPLDVLENPKKNKRYVKHYNRIINADMQYPILVYVVKNDDDNADADISNSNNQESTVIVDGLHRLSRAFMEKHPTIDVRYVTNKQLEKVFITNVDSSGQTRLSESGIETTPPVVSQVKTVRQNKKIKPSRGRPLKQRRWVIEGDAETNGLQYKTISSDCGCTGGDEIILGNDNDSNFRVEGGAIDEKKPGYYLYGVPQNSRNVQDIGVLYSLAMALNMEFEEFMMFTIKILKENPDYFIVLLNGELVRYFNSINELIVLITESFLKDKQFVGSSQFVRWNELFIDIARVCYDKIVIIFDDTSIITTGTSLKTSSIEDVNLILPNQVRYLEDIVPSGVVKNYILLLQRRKKSKSAFEKQEKVYYPIFIFVPYIFFKSHMIEKRVYTQQDEIMKLIKSMVEGSLTELKGTTTTVHTEIDFNILSEFISASKYTIERLYINSKDMCYASVLNLDENGKSQVYIPIKYSYYNMAEKFYKNNYTDGDVLDYGVFNRESFNLDSNSLKTFIEKYNHYVTKKSLALGMVKTIDVGTTDESRIIPVYPLIKMNHILAVSNNPGKIRGSEYSIIGLTDELGKHYYLNDMKGSAINTFFKLFSTGYNVFKFNYKELISDLSEQHFQYMYYDPTVINKIVIADKKEIKDKRSQLIGKAIYDKYLYKMFIIEFIRYFDRDRNVGIRRKVLNLVDKTSFKSVVSLMDFNKQIDELLVDYSDDASKIEDQVSVFYSSYFDKEVLKKEIELSVYRFDRITLVDVMSTADDYWVHPPAQQAKQHAIVTEKLRKISKNFTKIGEPNITDKGYVNILTSCQENNDDLYCESKKLVIPSNKYDDFINLFADDLLNPLKSPYIMGLIFTENVINEFRFERRPNEEIFIKV
jgi:hypothetical protein